MGLFRFLATAIRNCSLKASARITHIIARTAFIRRPMSQNSAIVDDDLWAEPADGRVVIFAGGRVIADSGRAFLIRVRTEEAVWIIPQDDVNTRWLRPSAGSSNIQPERQYYDVMVNGARVRRVGWTCSGDGANPAFSSHIAFSDKAVDRVALLPKTIRASG
ncbi:DUF427 domain-containing protein [Rhizobium sp. S152]|uniref:DUF427 domain-containing protein n=1 Tax=Rhizobium sp. S152 TaxID=3055038 RepID=UPI003FA7D9BA